MFQNVGNILNIVIRKSLRVFYPLSLYLFSVKKIPQCLDFKFSLF